MSTLPLRLTGTVFGLLTLAGAIGHTAQPINDAAPQWVAPAEGVLSLGGDDTPDLIVGSGPGRGDVRVFSGATLGLLVSGAPFGGGFAGGVRVAAGDITGDGVADVVASMGSAGGRVRAFDGTTLAMLADFEPYGAGFSGGVSVAVGDIDGDGRGDVVVAPASGAAPVRAYSGATGSVLGSGTPFGADAGGIHVAVGDITGDGRADIVTAQARGGLVSLFNGVGFAPIGSGAPYGVAFAGGVSVAVGDVNGDGRGDVITAPATGTDAVRAYDVPTLAVLSSGFPFGSGFAGGVRVAASDIDGDGQAEVTTAAAAGAARVRVFSGATQAVLADFLAFDPAFAGGAEVAVPARLGLRFTSAATTTFTVGTPGTFTVRAEGRPAVTSITRAGTLPAGVTFTDNGDGTGLLAGTPTSGTGGTYTLTFTARNGTARTATQSFLLRVEEAPAITTAASTTFRVGQAGTFDVITRGFPVPDLSLSGTLPAGVTFTDRDTGRATLAGTPAPGTSGVYPLTITAANGVGAAAVQSFTLRVESAPAFTSPGSVTFVVGTAQTFSITTTGEPAVSAITRTGTLPAGLSYTDNANGTATLAGTAAPGSGGTYPQTLTASNGVGTPAVQVLTITVQQAPQITSPSAATFVAGVAGTFTITATGSPAPSLTVTGALPAGVTFVDNGTGSGTLAGTAAAGGSFPLTVTASNGVGAPAVQSFTLTVQQAPAITSAATTSFNVSAPGSFLVTTTGLPVPAISVAGALPAGVTFADNGNGTGTIAGSPATGTAGTYALTITAANGVGAPAVQNFSLIVQAPPQITSASSTTFTVGTPGSFTVTATGSPTPTLSQTGALPNGVSFTPATSVLGGTPTQTGTFSSIQFTATNGVPPDATQSFTLTVSCPVITVSSTTLPDGAFNTAYGPITFTATGSTGSSLTWNATGLPAGLAMGGSTGSVSGTPSNTVLNASVTVSVSDEFGCGASRVVGLTVRPAAVNNVFTGGVGNTQFVVGASAPATPHVSVSGSVLTNDAGPGTLSAAVSTQPPNGTVAMGADGTFIYTPNPGFAGSSDTFVYTLTDGNGVTSTASVQIGLSGVVWYVNSAGLNGNGRSDSPFNSLAGAASASQDGQTIFVHTGAGATPGNLAMRPGQTLWGQGATFALNGLLIPGATRPTLSGTVTLATASTMAGVAFSTTGVTAINDPAGPITGVLISNGVSVTTAGGSAVVLSDVAGTFTFESISVNGGTNALSLTNVSGPFTVAGTGAQGSGGTIQNVLGDAVRLSNTAGVVSLASMIFQDIGSMAGVAGTVNGHDAIHGELVQGGLVLTGVVMRRLSDHAILGSQIGSPSSPTVWNNLSIVDTLIEDSNRFHMAGSGDGGDEAMIRLLGARGNVTVSGSTLRRGNEPLDIVATDGSLALTVTGSQLQAYKEDTGGPFTIGEHCIDLVARGAAQVGATIGDRTNALLGNTFLNCRVGSVRLLHDVGATGTFTAIVARNTFVVDDHSSPAGADFAFPMGGVLAQSRGAAGSSMNVLAFTNTFDEVTNASGGVGQLTLSAEGGQFQAEVVSNTFDTPGNAPWYIRAAENVSGRIRFTGNQVVPGFFSCPDPSCGGGYNAPGLRAIADAQRGGQLHLTIDGDTFAQHDTGFDPGNTLEIQANNVGAAPSVCAALRGNQSPDGYALEHNAGSMNLYNWLSAATGTCTAGSPATCSTVLVANNNTGGGGSPATTPPQLSIAGTISVTATACQVPSGGIFQP